MARLAARIIRPSSLNERRVLKTLGLDFVRVGRRANPFQIMRKLRSVASGTAPLAELKAMLGRLKNSSEAPHLPVAPTLPDSTSEPRETVAA